MAGVLSPTYIRTLPRTDGWSTPLLFEVHRGGNGYAVGSAGPNRTSPGLAAPDADDIVFRDGAFTQSPKGIQTQ